MQITPYLSFDGDCKTAFAFYKDALGGEITYMLSHGDAPADAGIPPGTENLIMHACLEVKGQSLMGADAIPGQEPKGTKVSVSLHYEKAAEGEKVFNALAEGGEVTMPFSETFWADGFGMLVDKFGTPWMINCGDKEM